MWWSLSCWLHFYVKLIIIEQPIALMVLINLVGLLPWRQPQINIKVLLALLELLWLVEILTSQVRHRWPVTSHRHPKLKHRGLPIGSLCHLLLTWKFLHPFGIIEGIIPWELLRIQSLLHWWVCWVRGDWSWRNRVWNLYFTTELCGSWLVLNNFLTHFWSQNWKETSLLRIWNSGDSFGFINRVCLNFVYLLRSYFNNFSIWKMWLETWVCF